MGTIVREHGSDGRCERAGAAASNDADCGEENRYDFRDMLRKMCSEPWRETQQFRNQVHVPMLRSMVRHNECGGASCFVPKRGGHVEQFTVSKRNCVSTTGEVDHARN